MPFKRKQPGINMPLLFGGKYSKSADGFPTVLNGLIFIELRETGDTPSAVCYSLGSLRVF